MPIPWPVSIGRMLPLGFDGGLGGLALSIVDFLEVGIDHLLVTRGTGIRAGALVGSGISRA